MANQKEYAQTCKILCMHTFLIHLNTRSIQPAQPTQLRWTASLVYSYIHHQNPVPNVHPHLLPPTLLHRWPRHRRISHHHRTVFIRCPILQLSVCRIANRVFLSVLDNTPGTRPKRGLPSEHPSDLWERVVHFVHCGGARVEQIWVVVCGVVEWWDGVVLCVVGVVF